jgi:cation transport ATPase
MGRASDAIEALAGLQPRTAHLVASNGVFDVPVDGVGPGQVLRVRTGERIPADGVVTDRAHPARPRPLRGLGSAGPGVRGLLDW